MDPGLAMLIMPPSSMPTPGFSWESSASTPRTVPMDPGLTVLFTPPVFDADSGVLLVKFGLHTEERIGGPSAAFVAVFVNQTIAIALALALAGREGKPVLIDLQALAYASDQLSRLWSLAEVTKDPWLAPEAGLLSSGVLARTAPLLLAALIRSSARSAAPYLRTGPPRLLRRTGPGVSPPRESETSARLHRIRRLEALVVRAGRYALLYKTVFTCLAFLVDAERYLLRKVHAAYVPVPLWIQWSPGQAAGSAPIQLGPVVDLLGASCDLVNSILRTKMYRKAEIRKATEAILKADELELARAGRLRGKLGFAVAQLWGEVGRAPPLCAL